MQPFLSRLSGLVLLVLWGTLPAAALAGEVLPGPVPAKVLPVVDGATIVVSAHIWLGQKIERRRSASTALIHRSYAVNAPLNGNSPRKQNPSPNSCRHRGPSFSETSDLENSPAGS